MLGHKSFLPRFISYLILVLFFVVLSVSARGQTTNGSAVATNPAAPKEEPAPLPVNQPASLTAGSERASAAPDSTTREEKPPGSKADAPKTNPAAPPPQAPPCKRTINADVIALPQPIMLNRMGAAIPDALIFALKSDTTLVNGWLQLRPDKRPRPLVLRANVGDCLNINFTNSVPKNNFTKTKSSGATGTTEVSLHIQGTEWTASTTMDDGSFVGVNPSSLASVAGATPPPAQIQQYKLFVKNEGTYLLYTMGDTSTDGQQLARGLFGALNVEPADAQWFRSEVTQQDLKQASNGVSSDGHPVIDYNAVYPAGSTWPDGTPIPANTPILNMLDANNNIVHTDLTAIITGPKAGRFWGAAKDPLKPEPPCNAEGNPALNPPPGVIVDPLFCRNPAAPDRKQPYREVTIIYHEVGNVVTEAFPAQSAGSSLQDTLTPGADNFAINYGTGGIAAEVYANRIGVGPMGPCVDCKFEEFFLSAWAVGDPAMLVDKPANSNDMALNAAYQPPCNTIGSFNTPPCGGKRVPPTPAAPYAMQPTAKATKAFYPDDPSNVYHSYINDHIKFRILHGGTGVTHVHHQHAHQWLQSPNSDEGSYLDSQMISPGSSYTLEMTYNGSGNRNKVVGDSIFHCHFYPHFAAGMWAMWRTHDVFERGTELDANGRPAAGARALPDGEIKAGTAIPGLVPLPTLPMAPLPSDVFIDQGQVVYGTPATPDPKGLKVTANPGFPFFIPGRAGARAPHPPLDFAPDTVNGGLLDGGLPRHLVTGGTISYERHNKFDWSKDLATMIALQLPETGTHVEQVAMKFFGKRCYATFSPEGTPGSCPSSNSIPPQSTLNTPPTGFILNGLPLGPQHGAPFADPAIDDNGNPVGLKRTYKAAAIQLNVTFNQKGWHYPQQRMLTLWQDVAPTFSYTFGNPASGRKPEPLFFRGNSGDVIEYWHTNLVPNYYLVDDFQVRTPTDIIGQHIHLVKFDVTSSDGAGNGFNYEDGTFSPEEVQDIHKALTAPGGSWTPCVGSGCTSILRNPQPPPAGICAVPGQTPPAQCTTDWMGAQTTIQRWYLDPLVDDSGVDRTLRTVFTHDHFGPSTHQQAGLYAGLVVEPRGSIWQDSENGSLMGQPANLPPVRPDGGPTSWKANIVTKDDANNDLSYREFVLEFQDFALAYDGSTSNTPNSDSNVGFRNVAHAINAPLTPLLVSTPFNTSAGPKEPPGTQTVNYLQEPIAWRISSPSGDMSYAYDSAFKQASNAKPNGDPITPLLRAYQNDRVQVRVLVGAHMFAHQFNLEGPRWFSEPGSPAIGAANNSGYRSVQAMGLSEHFEFLFNVPSSSAPNRTRTLSDGTTSGKCPDYTGDGNCTDYLYSPSLDDTGVANGMWGLFRVYDPNKMADKLQPLTSNPISPTNNVTYATCPVGAPPRTFNITAVTAQAALPGGQIVYNSRVPTLRSTIGVMYVRTEDLVAGKLKAPVEPLILRANAGDCITVNLTNKLAPTSLVYQQHFSLASPFNGVDANGQPIFQSKMSKYVGLHPQLLSYDAAISDGINVGWNSQMKNQVVGFNQTIQYQWYAGKIDRNGNSNPTYTPVEFGSLNLFPSDPVYQHINGLFGQMIIEPPGSTWKCGDVPNLGDCDPPGAALTTRASATVTLADNTTFREFSLMISDDLRISQGNTSAVNYRTEPQSFRYAGNTTIDFSCMLSDQLIQTLQKDPKTPILTADVGDVVRFRMTHPFGTGTSQVFTLHGHVWQRNPYTKDSQVIGDNSLSQWLGSRDNHGATDHFELVLNKAGGEAKQAGDYLYTVFLPNQAKLGAWGIFRVGPKGPAAPAVTACKPVAQPQPVKPKKEDDLQRFIRQPVKDTSKP